MPAVVGAEVAKFEFRARSLEHLRAKNIMNPRKRAAPYPSDRPAVKTQRQRSERSPIAAGPSNSSGQSQTTAVARQKLELDLEEAELQSNLLEVQIRQNRLRRQLLDLV